MNRTYRFRIYPTVEQAAVLDRQLSLCRTLYNAALEQRISAYRKGVGVTYNMQQNELPAVKRDNAEYNVVHSQVLQDVLHRLDKAFKNFFRRVREKAGKAGFPRFRPKDRYDSITYPQLGFAIERSKLRLSKIGNVKIVKHREIQGRVRTCTIKRDRCGDWYASFSCELPDVPPVRVERAIGVDVGLKALAVTSTGDVIKPQRLMPAYVWKLKHEQKALSRKQKGSENRRKQKRTLARVHRKIERARDDYLHKAAKQIVDSADMIVFENLSIQNMLHNHTLALSITDASWGKLMQFCAYKAEEAGKRVEYIDPGGTSQICSQCGATVRKSLSDRVHECQACSLVMDRDLNASLNILGRGRIGLEQTESELENACEEGRLQDESPVPLDEAGTSTRS